MPADVPAIRVKPRSAATKAITRNRIDQDNILTSSFVDYAGFWQGAVFRQRLALELIDQNIVLPVSKINQGGSPIQVRDYRPERWGETLKNTIYFDLFPFPVFSFFSYTFFTAAQATLCAVSSWLSYCYQALLKAAR
jgi:hypothetical protein